MIKIAIQFLDLIYSKLKSRPFEDKVCLVSRQSDEISLDFQILYEWLSEQYPDKRIVVLCKKLGSGFLNKIWYGFHLLKQMREIATAKYVILDGYCITVSALSKREGQIVIQMWHAMGALKRFGWSIVGEPEGRSANMSKLLNMHRGYDYYLVSSENCVPYFQEAYGYLQGMTNESEHSRKIIANLPRTLQIERLKEVSNNNKHQKNSDRVALYLPTFRKCYDISAEFEEMTKIFSDSGYKLIIKPHPLMKCEKPLENLIAPSYPTLDLMQLADIIVLDYSAAVFEAVRFDKEIVFFAPDFEEYVNNRSFYIDYEKEMPGKICKSHAELYEYLNNLKATTDINFSEKRKAFTQKWTSNDSTQFFYKLGQIIE